MNRFSMLEKIEEEESKIFDNLIILETYPAGWLVAFPEDLDGIRFSNVFFISSEDYTMEGNQINEKKVTFKKKKKI